MCFTLGHAEGCLCDGGVQVKYYPKGMPLPLQCICGSKSFKWSGEIPCTGYKICLNCGKEYRNYKDVKGE